MYIWVGIDVESQLGAVRKTLDATFESMEISNANCKLPLHISLKISFEIPNGMFDSVLSDIEKIYNRTEPFDIEISGIEKYENIVWIRMRENRALESLSYELNMMLNDRYGIGLHEYDLDYKFHTTLFMDGDSEKIDRAFSHVSNLTLPKSLRADKFIIGNSESGRDGTYFVYKEIQKNRS